MSKEGAPHQPEAAAIPQLGDPKHPGMLLVSRIALFSLSIFLVLIALLAIAGNRVMLNFELDASADFQDGQLIVTLDEQKATVFEQGDNVGIHYEDGITVSASVSQIGLLAKGKLSLMMTLDNGEMLNYDNEAREIGLTVQQPLKAFIMSKLGL